MPRSSSAGYSGSSHAPPPPPPLAAATAAAAAASGMPAATTRLADMHLVILGGADLIQARARQLCLEPSILSLALSTAQALLTALRMIETLGSC